MRILVTGVTGQVGGALVARLPPCATVLAADRCVLDLAQPQAIGATLDRLMPDIIFNPAAYTAVDKAEDEPELALRVNAEAPGVMARWAAARDVPLIHFSTDYVFNGSGERAWREDDAPEPLSVYGATKLAGETAIRDAGGASLIVRTSWVYAAEGKNFLRTIARLARERAELRIVCRPDRLADFGRADRRSGGRHVVGRSGDVAGTLRARRRSRASDGIRRDKLVWFRASYRGRATNARRRPEGRARRADCHGRLSYQSAAAAQFAARLHALCAGLWRHAAGVANFAGAGARPTGAGTPVVVVALRGPAAGIRSDLPNVVRASRYRLPPDER